MTDLICQVSIPYLSGVPEDVAVNVWAFRGTGSLPAQLAAAGTWLNSFYTDMAAYMSPTLRLEAARLKAYDLAAPEPRAPLDDQLLGLPADNSNDPLPEEVSICLSFRAPLVSGTNAKRRRGRIYLGPLSTITVSEDSQLRTRVNTATLDAIEDAVQAATTLVPDTEAAHCVWSRSNASFIPVSDYWVDNAFDTQRRRGPASTQRRQFTAP